MTWVECEMCGTGWRLADHDACPHCDYRRVLDERNRCLNYAAQVGMVLGRLVAAVTPIVDQDEDDPDVGYIAADLAAHEKRAVEQELYSAHLAAVEVLNA